MTRLALALLCGLSLTGCQPADYPDATPEQYVVVSKACNAAGMDFYYHGWLINCFTRKK